MKTTKTTNSITFIFTLLLLIVLAGNSGCKKDKDEPEPTPARKISYNLEGKDILGVTGSITFTEKSSTEVIIDISLKGATSEMHPAELCKNSAIEGGPVIITLNPIDATGESSTLVTSMTYNQLIEYDGFIQVLKSTEETGVILALADIGGNLLTSTSITYSLETIGTYEVSGTALFEKRKNENTLLTITINGTIAGETYPASINLGSIETVGGGTLMCTLNNVDGSTGIGYTNIRKLDSEVEITYDNWLVYDGYINIYQTSISLDNVICHGNIGSN